MKTSEWSAEIERFSTSCGPACVAAALGISKGEAADRLLEIGISADFRKGWTDINAIGILLDAPVEKQSVNWVAGSGRIKFTDRFLTVSQWLEENRDRVAIIRASDHAMYVGYGMILEDNGMRVKKGRVTHAVFLDRRG